VDSDKTFSTKDQSIHRLQEVRSVSSKLLSPVENVCDDSRLNILTITTSALPFDSGDIIRRRQRLYDQGLSKDVQRLVQGVEGQELLAHEFFTTSHSI